MFLANTSLVSLKIQTPMKRCLTSLTLYSLLETQQQQQSLFKQEDLI